MSESAPLPLVAPSDWFMPSDDEDDIDPPVRRVAAVAPPLPAPYLSGIPQIPDELLEAMDGPASPQRIQANRLYEQLKQQIFFRRHDFEDERAVVIIPEPPKRPKRK